MNKFRNVKTNGSASKKEHARAQVLRLLQRAGKISSLKEQVWVELIPKQVGERACAYICDFVYLDNATGKWVWEDTKGVRTKEYIIKRKLMLWVHEIRILET